MNISSNFSTSPVNSASSYLYQPQVKTNCAQRLSDKPSYEDILQAVSQARPKENDPPENLAHLLEHLNKDWLFKLSKETKCPKVWMILGQKIQIRCVFEKVLEKISIEIKDNGLTCFICFAFEEEGKPDEVRRWLENHFVPDLALAGVTPVFSRYHLLLGEDVPAFEERILTTDKVVIICTRSLMQKCQDRQAKPYGAAREVQLAKQRDRDHLKKDTNFLVYLEGGLQEYCPDACFKDKLVTVLNEDSKGVWSYYSKAIELFAAIIGIEKPRAEKIKEKFFQNVNQIFEPGFELKGLADKSAQQDTERQNRIEAVWKRNSRLIWKNILPPDPLNFSGRIEELQQLKTLYESGNRLVAIIGPNGVGKSALALNFAHHQYRKRFEFISAIQVSKHASLRQGLLKLANELNFSGTEDERLSALRNCITRLDKKHLFLLDNLDDDDLFDELKNFIDSVGNCCFLMTSIVKGGSERLGFKLFTLKPLHPDDAAKFIQGTRQSDHEGAKKLAAELHHFPSALARAADYIRTYNCSFTAFLTRYRSEGTKLLALDSKSNIRANFMPWWDYLKKIQKKMNGKTYAAQILIYFSIMREKIVPREKLESWAKKKDYGLDFDRALGWLLEYSLIESPSVDNYALHPFLSDEIIDSLQKATKRKSCLYAMNFQKHVYVAEGYATRGNSPHNERIPIKADLEAPITAAVKLLSEDKFLHLSIEGHSDFTDSVDETQKISKERADYVRRLIVQDDPTFGNRTTSIGFGHTKPLDTSTDPAHERNRVVVIRIDIERSIESEDLFVVDELPNFLNGEENFSAFTNHQTLQNLVIEAVKIKLHMLNFVQYVFFDHNRTEIDESAIENILATTADLLRKSTYIHLTIEGHVVKAGNNRETPYIGAKRAEYLKELFVKYHPGDPHKFAKRINTTNVEGRNPLDTSNKPILKRNSVAIIRIDIEKSTAPYLSELNYKFSD